MFWFILVLTNKPPFSPINQLLLFACSASLASSTADICTDQAYHGLITYISTGVKTLETLDQCNPLERGQSPIPSEKQESVETTAI
ncbi:hypothetical protein BHYA_0011g00390 [Botrytis hyacinthi]|uniref:Uncharacterized protein n=1 Tax=Botrytis hyacinthi TaxID=278943 RepID=A0A4Z1H060_9HELO|nr:hypothetical protein BHYA_0011g00390 [Botrytis hyacinthi]